jgi:hypothetical protein
MSLLRKVRWTEDLTLDLEPGCMLIAILLLADFVARNKNREEVAKVCTVFDKCMGIEYKGLQH